MAPSSVRFGYALGMERFERFSFPTRFLWSNGLNFLYSAGAVLLSKKRAVLVPVWIPARLFWRFLFCICVVENGLRRLQVSGSSSFPGMSSCSLQTNRVEKTHVVVALQWAHVRGQSSPECKKSLVLADFCPLLGNTACH